MENLPRIHNIRHPRRNSKKMKSIQCKPEHFNGRIIFRSMFDDIMWGENDNTEECAQNVFEVSKYARRFPCGRWSFLGLGPEKTWYNLF